MTETPEQLAERAHKQLLDDIVNDYLDTSAALEKYEDRKRHIAEELASLLGPGGRHEVVPGVGVTVTRPVYRFDPKLARKVLDDTQYNSICELVPSADLATKMLPGALAEQLRSTNGKPVVRRLS